MKGRAAALALGFGLALACERKAPGPAECRRFALAMYRLDGEKDLATPRGRGIRNDVDELTRECLVMPYDREYLRCAEASGRLRVCRAEFEMRKASPSERMLSH